MENEEHLGWLDTLEAPPEEEDGLFHCENGCLFVTDWYEEMVKHEAYGCEYGRDDL